MPNGRVLVVDDSLIIRAMIEQIFDGRPDIRVMGSVGDVAAAYAGIERLWPDVLTLDIALPGVDGLTFLTDLMRVKPMPVVIVSSATVEDADVCRRALALGASACFDKARIVAAADDFVRIVQRAKTGHVADPAP